jgi:hypothetical protein
MERTVATDQIETTDAFSAIELFQERGWTDGLPVIPPTEERVEEFLAVAGVPANTVLLEIPMTHREVTVRLAAINAVMAGCLPEYFPVILAAIKGWADPRWGSGDPELFYISSTSTGGGAQMLIVNGPIADELGINSKTNVYGPGNRANSAIGRAIRLILINAGGFIPGVVDNAAQGHPGKFSFCIAENEDESPWEPLHVERGFDNGTSTVTTISCRGPEPIENRVTQSPEGIMLTIADTLSRLGAMTNAVLFPTKVVVMGPEHANIIAGEGWSKQEVKQFLHENCRRSVADLHRIGMTEWPDDRIVSDNGTDYLLGCSGPEDIMLVVAGGYVAGVSVLTNWAYGIPYGDYITIPIDAGGGSR